jgi:hypothetical protein
VLSIDGVYTLTNLVIIDPTWIDLVSWATLSHGVATIVIARVKDGLYHDQFSMYMFFPLAIEVFRFLHQQLDAFFHWCANLVWGAKGTKGPPLSILCTLYRQKVSMVLQHAQSIFILKRVWNVLLW